MQDEAIEWVREAQELRESVKSDLSVDDAPAALHESLIRHRQALDRLDALVSGITWRVAGARARESEARDELEDAEANASRLSEEYATAKEKNSHLSLQVVDQRIVHRTRQRELDSLTAAGDFIRLQHRGVDWSRRDLDTRIRLVTLQTSLER